MHTSHDFVQHLNKRHLVPPKSPVKEVGQVTGLPFLHNDTAWCSLWLREDKMLLFLTDFMWGDCSNIRDLPKVIKWCASNSKRHQTALSYGEMASEEAWEDNIHGLVRKHMGASSLLHKCICDSQFC